MAHLSIVSPVYRAEACVSELCRRAVAAAELITDDFEILLVDDRSPDGSWAAIQKEVLRDNRIRGIRLSRNFGQHRAITAGLDHVDGDWVVVMDCDLQDPPEVIPLLYKKACSGFEIVIAEFTERQESRIRQVLSRTFWLTLSWFAGTPFDYRLGNFRIMSRTVVENFCQYREQLRLLGGITNLMGFTTSTVVVQRQERFAGRSSYGARKLLKSALDMAVAYSDKPLRASVIGGVVLAAISLVLGVLALTLRLAGVVEVPGWAGIMVTVFLLSGVIIMNLGVLGVYIGRVFDETKRRPLYVVESRADNACRLLTPSEINPGVSRVIWITGLSGAGKTTLAHEVTKLLARRGNSPVLLDGDDLREVLGAVTPSEEYHGRDARLKMALQYSRLCRLLADQNLTVVISTISMFHEVHAWNRANLPNYFEVYLKIPAEELRRRDPKRIYQRFSAGEITHVAGLDLPVDEPREPHLLIEFTPNMTPQANASRIIHALEGELQ